MTLVIVKLAGDCTPIVRDNSENKINETCKVSSRAENENLNSNNIIDNDNTKNNVNEFDELHDVNVNETTTIGIFIFLYLDITKRIIKIIINKV